MNLEKICEALNETDELGRSIRDGCLVGQLLLFYRSPEEIEKDVYSGVGTRYNELLDGLLAKEYDLIDDKQIQDMIEFNDCGGSESPKDRHTRVLAHYEGLLIEALIAEIPKEVYCEVG